MGNILYVSSLNLRNSRRREIVAGTPFRRGELVPATFDSLKDNGDIVEHDATSPIVVVEPIPKNRASTGPANETPSAAIHPKKRVSEALTDAEFDEKEAIKKKLRKQGIKFAYNSRLDTLKAKLTGDLPKAAEADGETAKETESGTKADNVKKVWDADPVELANTPIEQIYAAYRLRCNEFGITATTFDTKEDIIAFMSSEFVG